MSESKHCRDVQVAADMLVAKIRKWIDELPFDSWETDISDLQAAVAAYEEARKDGGDR